MKTKFNITGMSCAACSLRVEKAVSSLDGVEKCSVNLLTNSMIVEGDVKFEDIISSVEKAGYGAELVNGKNTKNEQNIKKDNTKEMKVRFIASVMLLLFLMYISMGHMMWGWSLPAFLENDHVAMAISQMLLTIAVMVLNKHFFVSGFKSALLASPNMDTLVALGSSASFGYSVFALFAMSNAQQAGNYDLVMKYMHELYFESSAMILTLITLGKMLEEYSKGKTTSAIKGLMELVPKKATVVRDGKEILIDAQDLVVGDIFIVKPGESIATDAVVIEGSSAVDESTLTGESMPVDKEVGSKVSAATINRFGHLKCKATSVGEDTTLSKIIKMVSEASSTKAPIAKIADKVAGVFVPCVILVAIVTVLAWLILDKSFGFSLARGISVLVISCPCALGLATPVAIMVASGVGAKAGILFKTAESIEETGKAKICVFDKTGTLTEGKPKVTDILCEKGTDEKTLIECAYSLERLSEHPLSVAICEYATQKGIGGFEVSDFIIKPGCGLEAKSEKGILLGGNEKFIGESAEIGSDFLDFIESMSGNGKTPLLFSLDGKVLGAIAVSDTLKPDTKTAIEKIKKLGFITVMLTGDNKKTANAIKEECKIDEAVAEVMPDQKANVIKEFKRKSKVIMIGDGINDAPALTEADVGIAIGAGVDIAIDAADVVVTKSTITDVANAIVLSKKAIINIKQNLFWAFCYNIIGIPLAMGVWINALGWQLTPAFGAAAMSLSSVLVVTNALRLNFLKFNVKEKEVKSMEKIVKIEGMMCPHCEARVKKVLEEIEGVESVVASHKDKTAVITSTKEIDDDIIKSIIENEGYKII